MPRVAIEGDRVRITGVRNFDYRTRNDFTVHYEEREVLLSHLVALDFYVSYFMEGPVGHTFVSFIFDNAPPLSISRILLRDKPSLTASESRLIFFIMALNGIDAPKVLVNYDSREKSTD